MSITTRIVLRFIGLIFVGQIIIIAILNASVFFHRYRTESRILIQKTNPDHRHHLPRIRQFLPGGLPHRPLQSFPLTPAIHRSLDQTHIRGAIHCDDDVCVLVHIDTPTNQVRTRDISPHITMQRRLFLLSVIILFLSLGLISLGGRRFTKQSLYPLKKLAHSITTIVPHAPAHLQYDGNQNDEIGTITTALNTSYQTIAEQFGILRDFVAFAGHELKTPLTRLSLILQTSEKTHITDHGHDQIKAMTHVIDGLLRLARGHISKVLMHPYDTNDLLSSLLTTATHHFPHATISLHGTGRSITTDNDIRTIMVSNLIRNACLHTGPHPHITIIQDHISQTITISDKGPGFDPSHWEHPHTTGLKLVRLCAQRIGWTILLETGATGTTWILSPTKK
ncbi:MAG: HAMP domain-containing histidine kinase [Candidatus Absconditabacterales bacterium]|nr:HAMP domain-containing histidine kinase [Candidatus Absconditabacterales bacterium]